MIVFSAALQTKGLLSITQKNYGLAQANSVAPFQPPEAHFGSISHSWGSQCAGTQLELSFHHVHLEAISGHSYNWIDWTDWISLIWISINLRLYRPRTFTGCRCKGLAAMALQIPTVHVEKLDRGQSRIEGRNSWNKWIALNLFQVHHGHHWQVAEMGAPPGSFLRLFWLLTMELATRNKQTSMWSVGLFGLLFLPHLQGVNM